MEAEPSEPAACSFCGRRRDVHHFAMIQSNFGCVICSRCVAFSAEVLDERFGIEPVDWSNRWSTISD